jgi:hypothetical protein
MATVAAGLALPSGESLFCNDWNHHQTCERIGPPQPAERVEEQTAEQDIGSRRCVANQTALADMDFSSGIIKLAILTHKSKMLRRQ